MAIFLAFAATYLMAARIGSLLSRRDTPQIAVTLGLMQEMETTTQQAVVCFATEYQRARLYYRMTLTAWLMATPETARLVPTSTPATSTRRLPPSPASPFSPAALRRFLRAAR